MLGNDIVDLQKASLESNWRRKGYLDKLFSAQEQQQILTSTNPETTLWLFWSMKEAAYKIINRETSERFYSPKKFVCISNTAGNFVDFEGKIIHIKSVINQNFIHTIASSTSENLSSIQTTYLENTSNYLSDFNSTSLNYSLEKNSNGIPNLISKTNRESHLASVSHHGKYLAIVSSVL
ncbi:4'-phosphopantetheinyl transferase superfamily protein [Pedobacter sp. LMG 31464]|uniref:4'-phosphopantetheinyl transferase superfamily protein n=1 Tax=Pedobacter planticolens TaxID=2679964 RepID=A0A923IV56_9SPHI|nr:4'-phosphopantetheinyl transferase superfamily protein [Pedobacter planticolens]MBB2145651.1 4'-phosphopantetheinyl transferase superfamily protein [Pedobacter planticolens]